MLGPATYDGGESAIASEAYAMRPIIVACRGFVDAGEGAHTLTHSQFLFSLTLQVA